MNENELVFVDLSSVAHPIWHMVTKEPDPNACANAIIEKVHTLTGGHAHVAICLDMGRSFRKDLVASYKATRPAQDAALQHQINHAVEQLAAEGYPCWGVSGYEADDIIATAVARTLNLPPEVTALVVSADKDLLQLVGPRVRVQSVATGIVLDEPGVIARFGVTPAQMNDYLCLVGDTSDNIKGALKIGPKGAALLLSTFGTIDRIYAALDAKIGGAAALVMPFLDAQQGATP